VGNDDWKARDLPQIRPDLRVMPPNQAPRPVTGYGPPAAWMRRRCGLPTPRIARASIRDDI
jgi:hypothetical protein